MRESIWLQIELNETNVKMCDEQNLHWHHLLNSIMLQTKYNEQTARLTAFISMYSFVLPLLFFYFISVFFFVTFCDNIMPIDSYWTIFSPKIFFCTFLMRHGSDFRWILCCLLHFVVWCLYANLFAISSLAFYCARTATINNFCCSCCCFRKKKTKFIWIKFQLKMKIKLKFFFKVSTTHNNANGNSFKHSNSMFEMISSSVSIFVHHTQ